MNVYLQDDRTALHEACRSPSDDEEGLAKIVDMLVQQGCDINSKSSDIGEVKTTSAFRFCYLKCIIIHKQLSISVVYISNEKPDVK